MNAHNTINKKLIDDDIDNDDDIDSGDNIDTNKVLINIWSNHLSVN
jgi:hypothetical protein